MYKGTQFIYILKAEHFLLENLMTFWKKKVYFKIMVMLFREGAFKMASLGFFDFIYEKWFFDIKKKNVKRDQLLGRRISGKQ